MQRESPAPSRVDRPEAHGVRAGLARPFRIRVEDAVLEDLRTRLERARWTRVPAGGGMPLLLLHGWPDSFHRYGKVIPGLIDAFDVVVPSLPGFPFTAPIPPGARPLRRVAGLLSRLMTDVLGYGRFAARIRRTRPRSRPRIGSSFR